MIEWLLAATGITMLFGTWVILAFLGGINDRLTRIEARLRDKDDLPAAQEAWDAEEAH